MNLTLFITLAGASVVLALIIVMRAIQIIGGVFNPAAGQGLGRGAGVTGDPVGRLSIPAIIIVGLMGAAVALSR